MVQYNVPTELNPADHATRPIAVAQLQHSNCFSGPGFLYCDKAAETLESNLFTLIDPEADDEICPDITPLATKAAESQLGSQHFEQCLSWRTLYQTIVRLIHVIVSFRGKTDNEGRK